MQESLTKTDSRARMRSILVTFRFCFCIFSYCRAKLWWEREKNWKFSHINLRGNRGLYFYLIIFQLHILSLETFFKLIKNYCWFYWVKWGDCPWNDLQKSSSFIEHFKFELKSNHIHPKYRKLNFNTKLEFRHKVIKMQKLGINFTNEFRFF